MELCDNDTIAGHPATVVAIADDYYIDIDHPVIWQNRDLWVDRPELLPLWLADWISHQVLR